MGEGEKVMSDVESFLAAIRDEPDDDTVRLVFADWLEEHNDPRGEFIRIQCQLARWVPEVEKREALQLRERELLQEHGQEWVGAFKRVAGAHVRFDRGIIELSTSRAVPQKWSPWIQSFRLIWNADRSPDINRLLPQKRLRQLSKIDLSSNRLTVETDARRLLYHADRLGVKHIRLANNEPTSAYLLPHLDGWPWPRLRSLDLDGTIKGIEMRTQLKSDAEWLRSYFPTPANQQPESLMNSIGMKLRKIPAGTFMMGSPETENGHDSDEFLHRVTITKPFYLGIYPVTQGEYRHITGENPSSFSPAVGSTSYCPVEMVSWNEAVDFCRALSNLPAEQEAKRQYRLPTEAEWEYACRAGTNTRFSFGDDYDPLQGNLLHEYEHPIPVGMFKPNRFGLYDMHGQVREWCQDWYRREYYLSSPEEDPSGPEDGESKVLRGGSWDISADQYARSAYRVYFRPDGRLAGIGFRVVCEING
jgi:uncharacterized protein (TIGR02996 family)